MTYADKPWLKSYKLGPYKLKESLAPYPKSRFSKPWMTRRRNTRISPPSFLKGEASTTKR